MGAEQIDYCGAARVILGEDVEQIDGGQQSPAVGARPVKLGVDVHTLNPAVHVKAFVPVEHALGELQDLFSCVVEVAPLAGGFPREKHPGIGHSPFIADQAEDAGFQCRLPRDPGEILDLLFGPRIDQPRRGRGIEVVAQPVQDGGDLVGLHGSVGDRVIGPQQV